MTARLAVFGNPVAHSRSPDIHRMFGDQAGIELSYEKVLVPEAGFAAAAETFMAEGHGFNVTVPCKHDAWQWVDEASGKANLAQAVNTVSRSPAGKIRGDTTDGGGLVRDIRHNLGWELRDRRLLVVGAGGAVSSVLADLLDEQPASIDLCNRTHEKAVSLAQRFDHRITAISTGDLVDSYDVIINGTSAGLQGESLSLPTNIVDGNTLCYDMIYSAGVTPFNHWCTDQGCGDVSDGLGMLVEQAALAFEIWFDVLPDTRSVIQALRS